MLLVSLAIFWFCKLICLIKSSFPFGAVFWLLLFLFPPPDLSFSRPFSSCLIFWSYCWFCAWRKSILIWSSDCCWPAGPRFQDWAGKRESFSISLSVIFVTWDNRFVLWLTLSPFYPLFFYYSPRFSYYNTLSLATRTLFSSVSSSIWLSILSICSWASPSSLPHCMNLKFCSSNFSTVKVNFSSSSSAHLSFYRRRLSVYLNSVFCFRGSFCVLSFLSCCLFTTLKDWSLWFQVSFSESSFLFSFTSSSISFLKFMFLAL